VLVWREAAAAPRSVRIDLRDWLSRPGALRWFALLTACKAGDALATAMLRPFLEHRGLDIGDIGEMLGLLGFTLGLAGAALGGVLCDRFGRRRTLVLSTAVEAAALALYVPTAMGAPVEWLWAVSGVEAFTTGIVTASVFTVMMDASRPEQGATDFTVQASVLVLFPGLFGAASGFLARSVGYPTHFAIAAIVAAAGALLIALHRGPAPFDLRDAANRR
jgi:MFS family permease